MTQPRMRPIAASLMLLACTATGWAGVPASTPARLYLADGRVRDGLVLGGDDDSLLFGTRGEPQEIGLASVRLLSLIADDDLASERALVEGARQALVLRSGAAVRGRLEGVAADAVLWQTDGARGTRRVPFAQVKRVYVDVASVDWSRGQRGRADLRVDERTAVAVAKSADAARGLRERLLATAHHGEPFEQAAIGELGELAVEADALAEVARAARPDADALFRATERVLAQARDVDRAIDGLHAYGSVRSDWAQVRDLLLPEVADGLRRALRAL